MNYKMIVLNALLLPIALYGSGDETHAVRIAELEVIRFEKEAEIAQLSRKILEEARPYCEYREIALRYWNPSNGQDKEASFDEFIIKLCEVFDAADDINAVCEKAPLIKKPNTNVNLGMLRVALQFLFIDRLTNRYKQLVDELMVINKELKSLSA